MSHSLNLTRIARAAALAITASALVACAGVGAIGGSAITGGSAAGALGGASVGGVIGHEVDKLKK